METLKSKRIRKDLCSLKKEIKESIVDLPKYKEQIAINVKRYFDYLEDSRFSEEELCEYYDEFIYNAQSNLISEIEQKNLSIEHIGFIGNNSGHFSICTIESMWDMVDSIEQEINGICGYGNIQEVKRRNFYFHNSYIEEAQNIYDDIKKQYNDILECVEFVQEFNKNLSFKTYLEGIKHDASN